MAEFIHCDESGFSGNNLSDDGSPYFVFAGVLISAPEAEALVSEMKRTYRIQGEMKGANLTKHPNGRKAIAAILEGSASKAKVTIADKRFALAGELFEYIFEPALTANNGFFYEVGFHVFIANISLRDMAGETRDCGNTSEGLSGIDAQLGQKHLHALAATFTGSDDQDSPQNLVFRFAQANKMAIGAEMEDLCSETQPAAGCSTSRPRSWMDFSHLGAKLWTE